jgi:hypothetical protein
VKDINHAIRISKNLFGGEVEESITLLTGKSIVHATERVTIYKSKNKTTKKRNSEPVRAIFDTSIYTSRVNRSIMNRIGYTNLIKELDSLNLKQAFTNITDAQKFLDSVKKNENDIIADNIKKFITLNIDNLFYVVPIITTPIKIGKKIKDIDVIIMPYDDHRYQIHIGRKELKNYLISY